MSVRPFLGSLSSLHILRYKKTLILIEDNVFTGDSGDINVHKYNLS